MLDLIKKHMTEATVTAKLVGYPVFIWIFQYTGISQEASLILAILLVLDVITALIRVGLTDPSKFSSRVGIVGVISKCLTFMIPFIIAIVGKASGFDMTQFTSYALNILVVYEGYSVIGNIGQIRARDTSLNEYDAVSFLISKIQVIFKKFLDVLYTSEEPKATPKPDDEILG